jgi:hypothetical protein
MSDPTKMSALSLLDENLFEHFLVVGASPEVFDIN